MGAWSQPRLNSGPMMSVFTAPVIPQPAPQENIASLTGHVGNVAVSCITLWPTGSTDPIGAHLFTAVVCDPIAYSVPPELDCLQAGKPCGLECLRAALALTGWPPGNHRTSPPGGQSQDSYQAPADQCQEPVIGAG